MKIAIFTDCYLDLTGGIVSSIDADKEELERRGHTVYIFSSGYPRSHAELEKLAKKHIYQVKSCRLIGRGLTPIARRPSIVEKQIMREHPEIRDFDTYYVHYEAGCSIAGLRLARKNGVRSIQVMHGREDMGEDRLVPRGLRTIVAVLLNWFHSWYIPHTVKVHRDDYLANTVAKAKMWTLMVNHANYADIVVTPSKHFRTKLQHYGVTRPFEVLPHGLADDICTAKAAPRHAEGKIMAIWHSRLSGEKRIMEFLEAVKKVGDMTRENPGARNLLESFHVDIYGGGPDEKRARSYTRQNSLPVTFYGNTPHDKVWKELALADLDILASYNYDNYSMALVEAVVSGAPSFIVDPDMEEILPSGSYVLASDPSPEAMATALIQLIEHPERIEKMSLAAINGREAKQISLKIDGLERLINKKHQKRP